ncbi:MAG: phosphomannomutase/phosphoglucomutase [Acidimicrobiales bacterium]
MTDLDAIVKAYDIRGVVPDQLDADLAGRLGAAFGRFIRDDDPGVTEVLLGRDMRESGVALSEAFAEGVMSQGLDIVDLGLISTDLLYYASGSRGAPGVVFTASHNPAEYNGIKSCRAGAAPIGAESGLAEIRRLAAEGVEPADTRGERRSEDLLEDFVAHVHALVGVAGIGAVKVVADVANGMGGLVVPAMFAGLPVDLEVMYPELDGTFPNHPADPIQVENQRDLRDRVLEVGASIGLAFDGDADRVFIVDEHAEPLSGSTTTAMVGAALLGREPGGTVLYNLICSKSVPEIVTERGGTAVRTRVGHSYIKSTMAETGAIFAGEHSGHYYFRDNYRADSGVIAALTILRLMAESGQPLSELRKPFERYAASGEINLRVGDQGAVIDRVRAAYSDADLDELDGLTVDLGDWWFNLRASNTEPLLRLNLEAPDADSVDAHVAEVRAIIDGG